MPATIATLTTPFAQQRLQEDGLTALGLTMPLFAMRWSASSQPATFLADELALALPEPCAPFSGMLEWLESGSEFIDASGVPITDAVAVVRLHPQAAQRLERLAAARFTSDGVLLQPVPVAFVVRLADKPDRTPQRMEAGDALGGDIPASALASFHDTRGMIICPVAVAAMLADLLTALPALRHPAATGNAGDQNGLTTLAALATGNHVMLCDLHGALFSPLPGTGMIVQGGGSPGNADTGHITLSPGQPLPCNACTGAGLRRARWTSCPCRSRACQPVIRRPFSTELLLQLWHAGSCACSWWMLPGICWATAAWRAFAASPGTMAIRPPTCCHQYGTTSPWITSPTAPTSWLRRARWWSG